MVRSIRLKNPSMKRWIESICSKGSNKHGTPSDIVNRNNGYRSMTDWKAIEKVKNRARFEQESPVAAKIDI